MKSGPEVLKAQVKKPTFAFAIATACGVGYLPKVPGTFGSLVGCLLTVGFVFAWRLVFYFITESLIPHDWRDNVLGWMVEHSRLGVDFWIQLLPLILLSIGLAAVGVWSASRVATYAQAEDPQYVVIDEVSGQQLTYFLGLTPIFLHWHEINNPDFIGFGTIFILNLLNWKCLVLGFILFRAFDIWKPFPARQLEHLPGGWGIMADDWMAGIYAALVLRVALHFRVL
jgi:phosphatidylglycerophosphatase A